MIAATNTDGPVTATPVRWGLGQHGPACPDWCDNGVLCKGVDCNAGVTTAASGVYDQPDHAGWSRAGEVDVFRYSGGHHVTLMMWSTSEGVELCEARLTRDEAEQLMRALQEAITA